MEKKKIMKRVVLTTLLIIFLLGLYCIAQLCWIEPLWFKIQQTDIQLPPDKKLKTPLKILFLADFHAGRSVPYSAIEKAVDMGIKENPDLILLGGDFFTGKKIKNAKIYAKILKKLPDAAPAFACMGNHDGGEWVAARGGYRDTVAVENLLKENGIIPLVNQSLDIEVKGNKLRIIGLGDLWAGELKPEKAFTESKDKMIPVILLSHNPDSKEYLAKYDWDVMFCGHTHGGQLYIPFVGAPFTPVRDRNFISGLHNWQGRKIYISTGVGNIAGMRFNCRPEISIINLK